MENDSTRVEMRLRNNSIDRMFITVLLERLGLLNLIRNVEAR